MNPIIDNDPVQSLERLTEIAKFDLFSPDVRKVLDGLATKAATSLGSPFGIVSIVLDGAQYFAGSHGVGGWLAEAEGTPVEWSFCANVVRHRKPYIVDDATVDPLQHDNPLVVQDGIRSYAGVPIMSSDGHVLGAYCVVGTDAHHFTEAEIVQLESMAADVVAAIEATAT
jgi:GAF domain-containing protein